MYSDKLGMNYSGGNDLFKGILRETQNQLQYIKRADNTLKMEAWNKFDKMYIYRMTRGLDKKHPSLKHLISKESLISSNQEDLDILIDHARQAYDQLSSGKLREHVALSTDASLHDYAKKILERKLKNAKDVIALKIIDTSSICNALAVVEEQVEFDFEEISMSPTLRADVLTNAYPNKNALLKTVELEMYALKEFFELEGYWIEANLEADPRNKLLLEQRITLPDTKGLDAFAAKIMEYYTEHVIKKCQFTPERFQ